MALQSGLVPLSTSILLDYLLIFKHFGNTYRVQHVHRLYFFYFFGLAGRHVNCLKRILVVVVFAAHDPFKDRFKVARVFTIGLYLNVMHANELGKFFQVVW